MKEKVLLSSSAEASPISWLATIVSVSNILAHLTIFFENSTWSFLVLNTLSFLAYISGFRARQIETRESHLRPLLKTCWFTSVILDRYNGISHGYILGAYYLIWVNYESTMIISTEAQIDSITDESIDIQIEEEPKPKKQLKKFRLVLLTGNDHSNLGHRLTEYSDPFPKYSLTDEQLNFIDHVRKLYQSRIRRKLRSTVVHIHGPPGTGKSYVTKILSSEMNGYYYNLNPMLFGTSLRSAHRSQRCQQSAPLVVTINEIDDILVRVHSGTEESHQHGVLRTFYDKNSFNNFMDEVAEGLVYPWVILIVVSNRPPEDIHALDSSYLREGRIHHTYHFTQSVLDDEASAAKAAEDEMDHDIDQAEDDQDIDQDIDQSGEEDDESSSY